ncbi:MAG: hypothetical protein A2V60_02320 [Candidatus Portnoybacteria bacterium RIFCSPHIGHO2_01_FULL_39_19]|nr:MAG: hypothetical protein A2V60_02320 [Candidatus Portnoybacteria bacterium RIFCSPHIGHO2_01_FULL_39_19]
MKEEKIGKSITEDLTKSMEFLKKPEIEPQKVFPWEAAWVKKLDASNSDDIEAYKNINARSEVSKWMVGDTMNTEEIKELFLDREQLMYGVSGEKRRDRTEGWVSLYEPDTEIVDKLIKRELVDNSKDARVLEISFARLIEENVPVENRERGLIPSAIRQICFSLIKKQEKITIIAFTNHENLLSERVLEKAGFIIKGKTFYDEKSKEEDNFWVLDENELKKALEKKKLNSQ